MEFRLLGPFEVRDDHGHVIPLRLQQRAVLALLVLRPGTVVSTDRLVDQLWGERPPRTAVGSLHNTVSQLRRLVGPGIVDTRPPGYVVDVPPDMVDAVRFERLLTEAPSLEASARVPVLREALALWRGPALVDLADHPWARAEAIRLDELRLVAVEERIAAELEIGLHAVLVAQLEVLAAEHPLRERLRVQLALALYRSGRQAEALETCRTARAALDELGLEPSSELRELERDILRQDSRLAAPAAATATAQPAEAGSEPSTAERRVVSVLAASVPDEDDPEVLRSTLDRVLEQAADAVRRHGGIVEHLGPEGLIAVFGAEERREDDALRATRAAVELHAGAHLGVAVATGGAIVADRQVTSAAIARAAALAQSSDGVRLDPRTYDLVRDGVTVDQGQVIAVDQRRPDPRIDVALVGRKGELARLRQALAEAETQRRCVALTVVGEAGLGKSRLARELLETVRATVLHGRCATYGEGATFVPLVEALRGVDIPEALGNSDDAAAAARILGGIDDAGGMRASPGETYWAVRRLLEALALVRPVVLLFDDVHWAEPTLLDLVEYLAARITDAPLLVLSLSRPELLEKRPGWAGHMLRLQPLSSADARMLVGATAELDNATAEQVVELAEGNPLYAQQLAALAAESGRALEPGAMPATLDAVLAGRLGRLDSGERATLQRAAVVGREFSRSAVTAIAPQDLAVDAHLLALVRKGFVHAAGDATPNDDAYRFHHVLVRDAAYATLPKEQRAELHQCVAEWLDRDAVGDDVLVGYHLEQAAKSLREVGAPAEDVAAAAGDRLATAGIRAMAADDGRAVLNLLGRAEALIPPGPRRAEVQFELALVLSNRGTPDGSGIRPEEAMVADAIAEAVRSNAKHLEVRARLEGARIAQRYGRLAPDRVLAEAAEAITTLEFLGDHRGLEHAWITVSQAHWYRWQLTAAAEAAAQAEKHCELAGFTNWLAIGNQAESLLYGPTPVHKAEQDVLTLRKRVTGRVGEAIVNAYLGGICALAGRFEEARRHLGDTTDVYLDRDSVGGYQVDIAPLWMELEMLEGDGKAAARIGHQSVDALVGLGYYAYAATRAAQVADLELTRGNISEAGRLLELARTHAAPYHARTQLLKRAVEARLLAHHGDLDRAEALARDAVGLAANTDAPGERVCTLLALHEVMARRGNPEAARAAAAEAETLLVAKESSAGIERLRERVESL